MASIPLPALGIQQQPGPLDQYAKILGIQGAQQEQKLRAQQIQGAQQQNQVGALELKDMQTLRALGPKYVQKDADGNVTGFDFNGLANDATSQGVNPQTIQKLQLGHADAVKAIAGADEATRNNELAKNKVGYDVLEGVRNTTDPVQKQTAYQQGIQTLQKAGVDTSKFPPQVPDDQALQTFEAGLGMHAQILSDAKTVAETNAATQKANLDKMEAAQKGSPLTAMETDPSQMAGDKLPAAIGYLKGKIADPTTPPLDQVRATKLLSQANTAKDTQLAIDKAKKQADQSVQDGDPVAAAKLLVSGDVAPSQLISSRRPEFAQKAFTAAQQLQPGWNAQQADAQFKVASSPANVAFFGSAKSLTNKGGTLDQLADAAKDIPEGKIPVFNTVADVAAAAAGSGPIAKYASILLGVADDYSKVMGGGAGSDASRNAALKLVPTNASPDARAGAIEGIRGSVNSQLNSRIGSNPVLKNMYGSEAGGGAAQGGGPASNAAPAQSAGHVIAIGSKKYRYKGSGDTADLKNYTELP